MAMLDRVEVDVLDVPDQVVLVADRVLERPRLPDAPTPLGLLARRHALFDPAARQPLAGESRLDRRPPRREVAIARRQGPDGVEMVGQEDDRIDENGRVVRSCRKHVPSKVRADSSPNKGPGPPSRP